MSAQLGVTPGGVELATSASGGSGGGGGAPTGPAGGSLAGTYPNPSLAAGAVGTGQLAANAVTSAKIATGAVGPTQLADTTVTPGSYTNMSATVDQDGRLTAASNGTAPVTGVTGTAPITSSGGATPAIGISNSGTSNGRSELPIQLARATPAGVNTPTTASWTAGLYKEIVIKFWGRVNGYLELQVNGDTGLNYSDFGENMTGGVIGADNAPKGTNNFCRFLVTATPTTKGIAIAHFFPLTDGFERVGQAHATTIDPAGTAATAQQRVTGFCWHNTANDVTSLSIFPLSGQVYTGVVEIWGVPS